VIINESGSINTFYTILCIIEILYCCFTKRTNMFMSSVGAVLKYIFEFNNLVSSYSCETMNRLNLFFSSSWVIGEFSTKFWISMSIWAWSSGFWTTQRSIGLLWALDFIHILKNRSRGLTSKETRSLSSFWIAVPQSKSYCSGPTFAMVPPRVKAHFKAFQTE
jgi:hypothetical protein